MIKWPSDVVDSIARRRAVLFLGAGVSMNSVDDAGKRPPSWKSFLQDGIAATNASVKNKKEMSARLKSGDYLTCCQLIKYYLDADWISFLEEKFSTPKYKTDKIHESIFNLDASITLTPNFDRIYDKYASKTEKQLKIKKYYDEDIVRSLRGNGDQRLILKIHGCIDTPDKLIFTREDYSMIRHKHANFYRAIDALITTQTFLFIGFGLNDPDISLVLEQYARSFSAAPPHYILTSEKSSGAYDKMLRNNYNVQIIKYSDKNNHEELTTGLEALTEQVEEKRETIAKTRLW